MAKRELDKKVQTVREVLEASAGRERKESYAKDKGVTTSVFRLRRRRKTP